MSDLSKLREFLSLPFEQFNDIVKRDEFCAFVKTKFDSDREEYQDIWLPYIQQHKEHLPSMIREVFTVQELEEWAEVFPGFMFEFHYTENRLIMSNWAGELFSKPCFEQVQVLKITDHKITSDAVEVMSKMPTIRNLKKLILRNNNLDSSSDIASRAIAESRYLTQLESLDLSKNIIGYRGAELLCESKNMNSIKELDLSMNLIGFDFLEKVADSKEFHNLEYLRFVKHPNDLHGSSEYDSIISISINLPLPVRFQFSRYVNSSCFFELAQNMGIKCSEDESKEEILEKIWRYKESLELAERENQTVKRIPVVRR